MTIISLNHCCRLLAIDPKTFRSFLALEALTLQPHPADARIKGVTQDQLLLVAAAHRRTLASAAHASSHRHTRDAAFSAS